MPPSGICPFATTADDAATFDITPEPHQLRAYLRMVYGDPAAHAFRAAVDADAETVAFLTNGGTTPLLPAQAAR